MFSLLCLVAGSFKLRPDLAVGFLCLLAYIHDDLALLHVFRRHKVWINALICCLVCAVVSNIIKALCRNLRPKDIVYESVSCVLDGALLGMNMFMIPKPRPSSG